MICKEQDIAYKIKRKKAKFDKEYAAGNYVAADSIYDKVLWAAEFLEISDADIRKMFGLTKEDKNKRLGIFDTYKVMTAKQRVLESRKKAQGKT